LQGHSFDLEMLSYAAIGNERVNHPARHPHEGYQLKDFKI